jgi:hypothetical protein
MKLIHCRVTIKTRSGKQSYSGLFINTVYATMDAISRMDEVHCSVKVEVIK